MEILSTATQKVSNALNPPSIVFSVHEGASSMCKTTMGLETNNQISPLISASVSPDCPKTVNSAALTPTYSSPPHLPPLNLSSLPNTPTDGPGTELSPPSKRPSSAEIVRSPSERQSSASCIPSDTQSSSDIHEGKEVLQNNHTHDVLEDDGPLLSSNQGTDSTDNVITPDWNQALQQLASFCYSNAKTSDSSQRDFDEACATRDVTDPMTTFHAMLANMGQLLLGTQLSNLSNTVSQPETQTSGSGASPVLSVQSQNSTPHYEPTDVIQAPTVPSIPLTTEHMNGEPACSAFKSPTMEQQNAQSSPLALTASLLAMMAAQKPDTSSTHSNPFLIPSMLSNSLCSSTQSTLVNSGLPNLFTSSCTSSQSSVTDAMSFKPSGLPLPEGRDLLYQLGQHLMAMATGAAPNDYMPKFLNALQSQSSQGINFPTGAASFFSNPLSSIMNTKLFPPPPLHSYGNISNQNGSNVNSSDKKPVSFTSSSLPHFPATGTGLSGISMRGNQKYSAYYQHQRKQGFSLSAAGDFTNQSQTRRQPSSNPLTNPRYNVRRFRNSFSGANSNPVSLDARGLPRLPGIRGVANAVGGSIYPNLRGTSYKHSLAVPGGQPKPQNMLDPITPGSTTGTVVSSAPNDSTPVSNRLRDTAFLCSCGEDFESLYVFTLHMKDTGHKPKSDQTERDIPKLVRGQDMWINSETEQTREILRCMRCHQSFRNLPELTMHMMKTNHYSEIVYNDSGRLVFVNPDEPRRGSGASSASAHISPSKNAGCNFSGSKRSSRGSTSGQNSNTGSTWSNGLQSPDSADSSSTVDKHEPSYLHPDAQRQKDACGQQVSNLKHSNVWNNLKHGKVQRTEANKQQAAVCSDSEQSKIGTQVDSYRSPNREPPVSPEPPELSKPSGSPSSIGSNKMVDSELDNTTDSPIEPQCKKFETNVLRQIESFVENSLQGTVRGLSVKVENCSSTASQISSPQSLSTDIGPTISAANSSASHHSPTTRKRTYSEANLSDNGSPASPSTDESDLKCKQSEALAADSVISPIKVTSSIEPSSWSENPLSSLQKLVETTHKPVPPTAAFSAPSSSTLFVSSSPSIHSSKAASSNRPPSISNNLTPLIGHKTSTAADVNSASFNNLVSPIAENSSITPALSALYAYVEKSSPCQSRELQHDTTQRIDNQSGRISCQLDTGAKHRASPQIGLPDPFTNPALQALYAAAISTFAAQNLSRASADSSRPSTIPDPLNLFNQAAVNLKKVFESSATQPSVSKPESSNVWMKMLEILSGVPEFTVGNELQAGSESMDISNTVSASHTGTMSSAHLSPFGSENRSTGDCVPNELDSKLDSPGSNVSRSTKLNLTPSRSPPASGNFTSTTNFRSNPLNVPPSRYPPPAIPPRPSGSSNGPSNLMSTMITKKAKCHFCGKPFANKGQVRLHISKNKCPCLLQQSCHVAALAAAFGSETRSLNNNNNNSVSSLTHSQAPNKSSVSSNPKTTFNPLTGGSPSHHFTSHHSNRTDDSSELPSALSLLKERFQNFDLMHQRQLNRPAAGFNLLDPNILVNPFSSAFNSVTHPVSDGEPPMANRFFPTGNPNSGQWNGGGCSTMESNKLPSPYHGFSGVTNASAAANASHLAAMALLAQTLAQLTSSQAARPSTTEDGNKTGTLLSNANTTSLSTMDSGSSSFPFINPNNFNLDLLLNQTNFAKQLSHMNWNDQSIDVNPQNSPTMPPGR